MAELAILYDASRCSGCKGCQSACKCWNLLPSPMGLNANPLTNSYQSPLDLDGDTRIHMRFNETPAEKNMVEWGFERRSCMHCTNAGCVKVCPSGALSKDPETGMTKVQDDLCIGCQYCKTACPFDVPRHFGVGPTINKCTACLDRVAQDRAPACVKTCPPAALDFGPRDEMLAIAHERVAWLKGRGYDRAEVYGETELGGLHVISVQKYGVAATQMPINPQINNVAGILDIMKPLAAIGTAAIVGGLGISFLTGLGYKRDTLHYDEVTHDVIDLDTGEVVRHVDEFDEPVTALDEERKG